MPEWNTISISGYHIREAGSTAVQEVAFTLANAIAYIDAAVKAGLTVDSFAPRLSFFFNSHNNFLEEIAKFRAARRLYATIMRDRFGATNPRSTMMRFHVQTGGSTLTAQQPDVNVVRVSMQALAAVLGGAQSLHTNGKDEALALPTEESARLALRTQQIIAHESGVTNTADPLGGSYFVETLTNEIERGGWDYIHKIDALGGMVNAIERGYPQREIAEASYNYQLAVDSKEKIIVGVNDYVAQEKGIELLQVDETVTRRQSEKLKTLRAERSNDEVTRNLNALRKAAAGSANLMPFIYDAVKSCATLGEICDAMRDVFGIYQEVAIT
jgi:methylmalonyl-CoA mutase, N-terminal domain